MLIDRAGDDLVNFMRSVLKANDLCVTMGAGDIHRIGEALAGVRTGVKP
jgi:UDP-N-acetylmuramate-alanine ligase